jgi:hypothetical protein
MAHQLPELFRGRKLLVAKADQDLIGLQARFFGWGVLNHLID